LGEVHAGAKTRRDQSNIDPNKGGGDDTRVARRWIGHEKYYSLHGQGREGGTAEKRGEIFLDPKREDEET